MLRLDSAPHRMRLSAWDLAIEDTLLYSAMAAHRREQTPIPRCGRRSYGKIRVIAGTAQRAGLFKENGARNADKVRWDLQFIAQGLNPHLFCGLCGTSKLVSYKETHDLTLLDALRPFHPLRVGEAGGALSRRTVFRRPMCCSQRENGAQQSRLALHRLRFCFSCSASRCLRRRLQTAL